MTRACILLTMFFLVACKVADEAPPSVAAAPTKSLLQTQGCTVTKLKGDLSVDCSDGSAASAQAGTLHVKDGNGQELPTGHIFVAMFGTSFPVLLNSVSGHILMFDISGKLPSIDATNWDGLNCTGNAYASTTILGLVLKNKLFTDSNAWPGGAQVLVLSGSGPSAVTIQSTFRGGSCSNAPGGGTNADFLPVRQASFDATDVQTLAQPLELVIE